MNTNPKSVQKLSLAVAALVFSLSVLIRYVPFAEYAPVRGVFYSNLFYGIVEVVKSGEVFFYGDGSISSTIGRNVYASSADLAYVLTNGVLAIVTSDADQTAHIASLLNSIPWQGLILFPAVSLMLLKSEFKVKLREMPVTSLGIFTFSLLGTYQIIYLSNSGTANAPVGWSLLILSLWAINRRKYETDNRYILLFFIFLLSTFSHYHTAGIIITVSTSVLLLLYFISGQLSITTTLVSTSSVFSIFYIYYSEISVSFFSNYILGAFSIITSSGSSSGPDLHYKYIIKESLILESFSIIPKVIISILFVGYSVLIINRIVSAYTGGGLYESITTIGHNLGFSYLISFIPVSILLLLYAGLTTSLLRTFQWTVIIFPLVVAGLAHKSNHIKYLKINSSSKKITTIVLIAICVCAVTSGYLFMSTEVHNTGTLSDSEYEGTLWSQEYVESRDGPIYTDYRLSSAFLSDGYFSISSIWVTSPSKTNEQLKEVYYGNSPSQAISTISNLKVSGKSPSFIYLSSRMTNDSVGINHAGHLFKPMSEGQLTKFDQSLRIDRVYSNGNALGYST